MAASQVPPSAGLQSHAAYAEQFASDPRIHYNTVTATWQFEDDSGTEMEWDMTKGAWLPLIDEELVHAQQAAYKVEGVDEESEAAPLAAYKAKKRKNHPLNEDFTSNTKASGPTVVKRTKGPAKKKLQAEGEASSSSGPPPPRASKNTAVYVTALPPDTTSQELYDRFSRFGVIEIDDEDQPKIKLYNNDQGEFNGEALVVYFKEESVALAINMLDDAELRLGESSTRMRVKKAEFTHKSKPADGGTSANAEGEKKPRVVDRKKATKRIGKMQSKLNDWDSDDDFGPSEPSTSAGLTNARVVVLRHMFTLKDLEEDPSLLLDLKEDVREECETLGIVTNVVLYDNEPEGIMTIKFKDPVSAQACILKMNGRFFDGRKISASLYTGKERFKKSGQGQDMAVDDDDEAEKQRLEDFADWLENDTGS